MARTTAGPPARARVLASRPTRSRAVAALCVAVLAAALAVAGVAPASARAATRDHLGPDDTLTSGASLVSADGRYTLILQTDGNLVLYAPGRTLWNAGTRGSGGVELILQTDGNLVLYDRDHRARWYTDTRLGDDFRVQTDGNVVLYGGPKTARVATWTTRTPGDTLTAGTFLAPGESSLSADLRYRLTLAANGSVSLTGPGRTLWALDTRAASPTLTMQADGNLVLYDGHRAVWSTLTWGHEGAVAVVRNGRVDVVAGGVVLWHSPSPPDTLPAGVVLQPGEAIASNSGAYQFVVQADGNLVLYGPGGPSWNSGTRSAYGSGGLVLQGDGNLVLLRGDGVPVWSTNTRGTAPWFLRIQDDGHLVLYALNGAPVWSQWARSAGLDAAVAAAAAFGAGSGERTAVAVLDRSTGLLYGAGDVDASYASASLMKVFIAARLLTDGAQADPATDDLLWRMITRSDDAAATALWPRAGGAGVTDWVQARYGISGLGRPTQAGWWGLTQVTANAMVRFYAAIADDPAVGPWLTNAMANAANSAADGWNQWFGIPSATTDWKVKQGWMCCLDSRSRLHSTGFVGGGRYTVAILTDGATAFYGQRGADVVTGAAVRLLPGGRVPA